MLGIRLISMLVCSFDLFTFYDMALRARPIILTFFKIFTNHNDTASRTEKKLFVLSFPCATRSHLSLIMLFKKTIPEGRNVVHNARAWSSTLRSRKGHVNFVMYRPEGQDPGREIYLFCKRFNFKARVRNITYLDKHFILTLIS